MVATTPQELESRVTGGVDTHGDIHAAAVLDSATGRLLGSDVFTANPAGYASLVAWMASFGAIDVIGVECTGSWGAGLTRHLTQAGIQVVEVDRPDRKARRYQGKSDPTDAVSAARAALSGRATAIPKDRNGAVEAIRTLEVVYHTAVRDRTRAINQFRSLIVTAPDDIRHRLDGRLSLGVQLSRARRFTDRHPDTVQRHTRVALRELARRIEFLSDQAVELEARIYREIASHAPGLLGLFGVGPHAAAQLLATVGDNPQRMTSEAAFAKLCGSCPLPASSGKTVRHRLNRSGDRRANNALYHIVVVRMRYDPRTKDYVKRRTAEGKSRKEIIRCLKRFVAREVFAVITNPPTDVPTGEELLALRNQRGLSLVAVASEFSISASTVSRLEGGLTHDNHLARNLRDWLTRRP